MNVQTEAFEVSKHYSIKLKVRDTQKGLKQAKSKKFKARNNIRRRSYNYLLQNAYYIDIRIASFGYFVQFKHLYK